MANVLRSFSYNRTTPTSFCWLNLHFMHHSLTNELSASNSGTPIAANYIGSCCIFSTQLPNEVATMPPNKANMSFPSLCFHLIMLIMAQLVARFAEMVYIIFDDLLGDLDLRYEFGKTKWTFELSSSNAKPFNCRSKPSLRLKARCLCYWAKHILNHQKSGAIKETLFEINAILISIETIEAICVLLEQIVSISLSCRFYAYCHASPEPPQHISLWLSNTVDADPSGKSYH